MEITGGKSLSGSSVECYADRLQNCPNPIDHFNDPSVICVQVNYLKQRGMFFNSYSTWLITAIAFSSKPLQPNRRIARACEFALSQSKYSGKSFQIYILLAYAISMIPLRKK